jgi:glycosyltransferase involved in cell wall biosynthesis
MRPYTIVAGDFVHTGGMDAPNFALASFLARAGHRVDLVAYRVDPELTGHPNVRFHRVPKPLNAYVLGSPLLATSGVAFAMRRNGRAIVNGGNCLVPATNWVHYVHAAFRPIVGGIGWRASKARSLHRVNVLTERVALRLARVVVANSERTRREIIERVGVRAERVHRVYYGVDAARFRPADEATRRAMRRKFGWPEERPKVAFVGALGDRRKGFDVVYDAWRALCAKDSWDADLVVVGTGAELPTWQARAAADGLAKRIAFLGFRRDVPDILCASDALVAPTRYEAYGAGVHEAICCGLPALVSASAGVAERYPEALGELLLEDPESADATAASLWRWRERRASLLPEVLRLSDRLRARSWDDMAGEIVAISEMS